MTVSSLRSSICQLRLHGLSHVYPALTSARSFTTFLAVMASSATPQEYPPAYLRAYIGNRSTNVAVVFMVLETVVVVTRFYAKTRVSAPLGPDDFLTIPALVRSVDFFLSGADIRRHVD